MNLIVTALKQKLAPFGWTETVRRGGDARGYAVSAVSQQGQGSAAGRGIQTDRLDQIACRGDVHPASLWTLRQPLFTHSSTSLHSRQAELQDIDSYLAQMGVKDANLRRRLETALPYTDQGALGAAGTAGVPAPVAPLNAAARQATVAAASGNGNWSTDTPVLLVCCDASGGMGGLDQMLAALELPVFAVRLPEGQVEDAPAELAELAMLGTKAMRGVVPPGARLIVAGVQCFGAGQAGGSCCPAFDGEASLDLVLRGTTSSQPEWPPLCSLPTHRRHRLWRCACSRAGLAAERHLSRASYGSGPAGASSVAAPPWYPAVLAAGAAAGRGVPGGIRPLSGRGCGGGQQRAQL